MMILNFKNSKKMNVLSLFDGISCGQLALERAGVKVDNYYASEIDKHAINVTKKNYPGTKIIGDVKYVTAPKLPKIDLLIGGSPCQGFSFAGKMLNFEDDRSKLFFEYYRILKELKNANPNILFFLENVPMKKESEDVISDFLGVKPIILESSLFVPQRRKRCYWTNIDFDKQNFKQKKYDIQNYIDGEGFATTAKLHLKPRRIFLKKTNVFGTLTASYYKGISGSSRPAVSIKEGFLDECREAHRSLTVFECEKLQGLPKGYTDNISKTQALNSLGNCWQVDIITEFFKNLK